jgi:hypothetical protein
LLYGFAQDRVISPLGGLGDLEAEESEVLPVSAVYPNAYAPA